MEKKRDGGQGRASLGRGEDGDDEEAEKVDVETDTSSSPSSCRRGYSLHCLHTHARCCSTSSGLVPAACLACAVVLPVMVHSPAQLQMLLIPLLLHNDKLREANNARWLLL